MRNGRENLIYSLSIRVIDILHDPYNYLRFVESKLLATRKGM